MYLDPGTGSVLFQVILAAILGAGVIIRVFWKNIRSLFKPKQAENNEGEPKE